jgi:superfamily II DNA or RNA helicase
MTFRELNLDIEYNSEITDVAGNFFIPVLKMSKSYRRVSAYYSSNSLKLIAEGLSAMINNSGTMKLLVSYLVSEEDFDAILHAKKQPEEILKSMNIDDEIQLRTLMTDENVSALGYLIASNRLDVKFVICSGKGIFHLKFGIFTDEVGDRISFSGSINETYQGLTENVEEFKVFRSWIPEELKYLESDSNAFDNYWNGKINRNEYVIVDMPEKLKNTIAKVYKDSEYQIKKSTNELPPLWPHQQTARSKWIENGYSGIIEMATGTGKTNVAISCIQEMANKHPDNLLVVVGCPTRVLVSQWAGNLREHITNFEILTISENETKDTIYRSIMNSKKSNHVIIGAYASLSKPWFTNIILEKYKGNIFFIGDEAHWLGAKNLSKALSDRYVYRLGLTATPVRYFDIEGTEKLLSYFKDTIFKYTLKEAILDGFLTPYDYYMFFAYLTEDETKEYQKLTKKYTRSIHARKSTKEDDNLKFILMERAKIVKKATNKIDVFREILEKLNDENKLNSLLIYVEDNEQLSAYIEIMDEFGIEYRKIDSVTKDEDRTLILNDLSENKIDCVIAMKVLDEGVDIKKLSRAIFVSSSGNSKQFIQRRGRILRKSEGKKIAEIFDICVLVDTKNQKNEQFKKTEETITASEFKRLAIFSISAHNKIDCYNSLETMGKSLNIDIYNIINMVRGYG